MMSVMLSSWQRVHPVHVMNVEQRQVTADLCTKPTGLP